MGRSLFRIPPCLRGRPCSAWSRPLSITARPVFEGVSFLLDDARTALVGENGAGKSTLLKCLTGALELNAGKVIRSRGLRVGSVPQDVPAGLADRTVREVLQRSLERIGQDDEWWRHRRAGRRDRRRAGILDKRVRRAVGRLAAADADRRRRRGSRSPTS